jgi:very-short-patch-repair endonuclease
VPARIRLPRELSRGPFTVAQGAAAGLSPDRLRGSDLHRPFYGVRSATPATTALERCRAYEQRMPEHAFFCSVTAAQLFGIPLPRHLEESVVVHVGVPSAKHPPRGRGVVGHRLSLSGTQARNWCGLRVAEPEQVWCQLGALLSVPDLVAAGDFLIRRNLPLTTHARLKDAVECFPGRRGKPRLRVAAQLLSDRAESRRESHLRVIIIQAGITGVAVNLPVTTSGGFRYRIDLAVPARKVAIEYQGEYHGDEAQRRTDMTRRARLEADGWYVLEVNADDLRDPAELVQRIRRVLAARPIFA